MGMTTVEFILHLPPNTHMTVMQLDGGDNMLKVTTTLDITPASWVSFHRRYQVDVKTYTHVTFEEALAEYDFPHDIPLQLVPFILAAVLS